MAEQGTRQRPPTCIRRDEPQKESVPLVQDPAMRAVLKARRRALLAEVAAIEKHLGEEPREPLTA